VPDAANDDDAGAEVPDVDPSASRICDNGSVLQLKYELYVSNVSEPSCTKPCLLQFDRMQIADDGSVWLAGPMRDLGRGAGAGREWIGHYDANGAALGTAFVDNGAYASGVSSDQQDPRLAVDDQGQGWLVAGDPEDSERSLLYRFDASLQQLDKHTLPATYPDLIRYPGHGVLLSSEELAVDARGYDGEQLWNTMDRGPGGRLAIDSEEQILVATTAGAARNVVAFTRFAADGRLLHERSPAPLSLGDRGWQEGLTFDAHDGLTVTTSVVEYTGSSNVPGPGGRIDQFDAQGASKWRWQFSGDIGAPAIDPNTGTTLAVGGPRLVAISPDGSSCRFLAVPGTAWLESLAVGPNGEIWVAGLDASKDDPAGFFGRLDLSNLKW
jgi:hypothetical protein